MRASDSAAQIPGRCSTTSRKQFTNTHASTESAIANGPYSVESRIASPTRCTATITPARAKNPAPRDPALKLSLIPGPAMADMSAYSKPLDETCLDQ